MTTTHLITATELEAMGSDARFELIQGVLYEMSPSSIDSSAIAMRLGILLGSFIYQHGLGIITGEGGGYLLERGPDTVIAPDVGFVQKDRLGLWPGRRGYFPGAPDLLAEVISPTDEPAEIRHKQALYDRIAIRLVWWIDPEQRIATVHAPGRAVRHLTEADTLDGEAVVPGFSLPLGSLIKF